MAQIPHADSGLICPLHKQDMSEVCHKCPLWVKLRGNNLNDDSPMDEWKCAIAWLPILLCENSAFSRQTGAAVESLRNNVVKRMMSDLNGRMIE